ncbi:TlpA family protein disulfide reductase [Longirhabdus pacifica]|uniref:TlpA family protein disulfide reductase n=1 Tax=Longirhabdus pacifica TaxID=2305227 RepID=UPI0013E8A270|nr:redoxin domain-containing protein [Longirhabdus pacifica]
MNIRRNTMVIISLILIAGLLGYTVYQNVILPRNASPEIGKAAPDFELNGLDNTVYTLDSRDNKLLIINFWATWCRPCRNEMPELIQLYEEYNDELEIFAINATTLDTVYNVESFVEEFELPFPVLLDELEEEKEGFLGMLQSVLGDENGNESIALSTYDINAFPTTFVIDYEGVIRQIYIGEISSEMMKNQLEPKIVELINEKK